MVEHVKFKTERKSVNREEMERSIADDDLKNLLSTLVPENHLATSLDAGRTTKKTFRILFEKVKSDERMSTVLLDST